MEAPVVGPRARLPVAVVAVPIQVDLAVRVEASGPRIAVGVVVADDLTAVPAADPITVIPPAAKAGLSRQGRKNKNKSKAGRFLVPSHPNP